MADYARVLEGLKRHAGGGCFDNNSDDACPYWDDKECGRHLAEDALELLKNGSYASVDRIHPHNAAFTAELIRAGYEDRIFLSHDHICCYDTIMTDPPTPQGEPHGLDLVHSRILPEMRALGIAENTIEKIIAGNIIGLYRS